MLAGSLRGLREREGKAVAPGFTGAAAAASTPQPHSAFPLLTGRMGLVPSQQPGTLHLIPAAKIPS